jgi:hypothetical protein
MSLVARLPYNSYKPITNTRGFAPGFVNYQKGCIQLAAASDKVYQSVVFSGSGRHNIAEILLKVVLSTKYQSRPIAVWYKWFMFENMDIIL